MTPQQSIERECARRGRDEVVVGCRALLRDETADPELVLALGGPGARRILAGGSDDQRYWLRVWGARGLLWAGADGAVTEIRLALGDESWRVREMALKVIARHRLGDLTAEAADARHDPVARVRQAADRALAVLTAAGA
jgi:HEAT repeat protein